MGGRARGRSWHRRATGLHFLDQGEHALKASVGNSDLAQMLDRIDQILKTRAGGTDPLDDERGKLFFEKRAGILGVSLVDNIGSRDDSTRLFVTDDQVHFQSPGLVNAGYHFPFMQIREHVVGPVRRDAIGDTAARSATIQAEH